MNRIIVLVTAFLSFRKLFVIFNSVQGWTLYEILRYLPEHNWIAYEQALKANPVLAKMAISGMVYSIGDWIAQVSLLFPLFGIFPRWLSRVINLFFTIHVFILF
jgi:protein Mpv17